MDANEFWCRAFLAAMGGEYGGEIRWDNHGAPAAYAEEAADAALAVAQRRGMVTGERKVDASPERVEFTANKSTAAPGFWEVGVRLAGVEYACRVRPGDERAETADGTVIRIKWGESMPPKPIEVWVERRS